MNFLLTCIVLLPITLMNLSCSSYKQLSRENKRTPRYSIEEIDKSVAYLKKSYQFLHATPELGKKEFQTQKYILEKLKKHKNLTFIKSELSPTAVIAIFDSNLPGPTIALRAEMDARPGTKGTVHSCGHDIHMSILLATVNLILNHQAKITSNHSQKEKPLKGKLVFLFQPAEEIKGGADDIVKESILKKLGVEKIYALHVAPKISVGTITLPKGTFMAGSNYFTLQLKGNSSHAATPEAGSNLPVVAAKIINKLSELPKKSLKRKAVISVSRVFNCGNQTGYNCLSGKNVIPGLITIAGTIRAFEDIEKPKEYHQLSIRKSIKDMLTNSLPKGVTYKLAIKKGAPPNHNDEKLFKILTPYLAKKFSGVTNFSDHKEMFSEDFAYYSQVIPSLYFGLGVMKGKFGKIGLHNEGFNAHPDSFSYGLELMTLLIESSNL